MSATETADETKPYVCDVEGCGRRFARPQGLGRHRVETHGFAPTSSKSRAKSAQVPEPDPTTYEGQVKLQLQTLAAPLKAQAADIDAKLDELANQMRDLRKARSEITAVLTKLDPPPPGTKPQANGRGSTAAHHAELVLMAKADAIADIIERQPERFAEGFTPNTLAEQLTSEVPRGLSNKSAQKVIEILRERNLIRADKVTRGGGMQFVLVGKGE